MDIGVSRSAPLFIRCVYTTKRSGLLKNPAVDREIERAYTLYTLKHKELMMEQEVYDQENFYHDELERDWDERYEPEYPDPDAEYESRYELEDY